MSTFQLVCPQCGIDLEADEKHLGVEVVCEECDYHFILSHPSKEVVSSFRSILRQCFPNGFRPESIIDQKRFKRKYIELYEKELLLNDTEFAMTAYSCGERVAGKIYVITDEVNSFVRLAVNDLLSQGTGMVYYSAFYNANAIKLLEMGLGTQELLPCVLKKLFPSYRYYKHYFIMEDGTSIEKEIIKVFGSSLRLALEELQSRLTALPNELIKQRLCSSPAFVRNDTSYLLVANIRFDENEVQQNRNIIEKLIDKQGYASLYSLNWENSAALNPKLSLRALGEAMFRMHYAKEYALRFNIIAGFHEKISAFDLLKAFCYDKGNFLLQEIEVLEKELNGNINNQGLRAAQATAIQLDRSRFVSLKQSDFDIARIDAVLNEIITTTAISPRGISSFAFFPSIPGYTWTPQLLVSYCSLLSQDFTFMTLATNNVEAGAICRKAINYKNYYQLVAMQALSDQIDVESIGDYAFNKGFLARRYKETINALQAAMYELQS